MHTPFEILAVSESANDAEVKAAYLAKIREFPPDLHPEKFKEVKAAFEHLQTQRERVSYKLFHTAEPRPEDLLAALKVGVPRRLQADTMLRLFAAAARDYLMRHGEHESGKSINTEK